ncbi:MAG: glutathione S-transferase N-terminal domain-containing protein [Rhodospirillales bacterium]|nr:glutathione S-transferase N-terminal domain-containing protein [Rhodospirillales bacterium]
MKLYMAPGACSLGIHILLEEIGKPYETAPVNLREGAQYQPAYTAINPKSKVPTLVRDDGSIVTEYPAIAFYLARTNPEAKLLGSSVEEEVRALEAMDYAVATIHMQGFARMFRSSNFTPNPADEDAVKARGRELAEKGFARMEAALAGRDYLAGAFSVADTALFYVSFWATARVGMTLPERCAAHYQRMLARPAVARAMAQEGLA